MNAFSNDRGQTKAEEEPTRGDVPALAGLILGVGAVGAAMTRLPWQVILISGILAGVAGTVAVVRAGKVSKNRVAKLTGWGGLLLGGFSMTAGLFLAPAAIPRRNTQDLMISTALESAILNFHVEYDDLPDVGRHIVTTDSPDGVRLLKILLGMKDVSVAPQNTRGIKLLSVREGKNRRNGLIYTEDGMSLIGLFDVYGNGYTVVLNAKPGEPLRFPFGKKTIELAGRNCAVFSPGKDGKTGTADDVTTW
jgi:hypothetical protein